MKVNVAKTKRFEFRKITETGVCFRSDGKSGIHILI